MADPALVEKHRRAQGVAQAAWLLEDAIRYRIVNEYPSKPEARLAHFAVVAAEVKYNRAILAMLVLSAFETPAWCGTGNIDFEWKSGAERCAVNQEVLLSGVHYIPPGWGLVLEVCLLHFIAEKFLLERRLQLDFFDVMEPKQEYVSLSRAHFGLAMLALELADCAVFAAFRPRWRLAFLARTGFLCLLPAVGRLARCVFACLWEFLSVAVFLVGVMAFFAWIGVSVFSDMSEGTEGFDTFPHSLNSMFVAGVSDEFVAVFLKSYTAYRWVGILWLTFLVIAHVLLLSLVLDTLVAAYMSYSETQTEEMAEQTLGGVKRAFEALTSSTTGRPEASWDVFWEFCQELCRSPGVPTIEPEQASIMFSAVDEDGDGIIDDAEWFSVCGVIQYRFWTVRRDSFLRRYPQIWDNAGFARFRAFVNRGDFDSVMTYVLFVNLMLVILETVYDQNDWPEPLWMENLELVFSVVYVGELALKCCVISFAEYWSTISNQFDFLTTWLLLFTSVIERIFEGNLSTYANMLRLLRLLRVVKNLKNLESVQFMVDTISKLLIASKDMMTLLGVVVFFFTALSVQVYGGELSTDNLKLEGTEYLEKHMAVLNCNDFAMSFGVWVVMLLTEYEPAFPDAVSKIESVPGSWMIFPIFYVCGVMITFELVKAFSIEVFMTLKKEWTLKQSGRARKTISVQVEEFAESFGDHDVILHYRARGDLSKYTDMRQAVEHLIEEEQDEGSGAGSPHNRDNGNGKAEGS